MAGKTVIAIAHRLSTIARMDRLVVLDRGRIVEQGTHDVLLRLDGHYAALWRRQSGGFLDAAEMQAAEEGGQRRGPRAYRYAITLALAAANKQRYSHAMVAPASAVISATSYGGHTSTKSIPTKCNPRSRRMIPCACQLASPPISGVPVPGANAGS